MASSQLSWQLFRHKLFLHECSLGRYSHIYWKRQRLHDIWQLVRKREQRERAWAPASYTDPMIWFSRQFHHLTLLGSKFWCLFPLVLNMLNKVNKAFCWIFSYSTFDGSENLNLLWEGRASRIITVVIRGFFNPFCPGSIARGKIVFIEWSGSVFSTT